MVTSTHIGDEAAREALRLYVAKIGSQRKAAKRIGVDKRTLNHWLSGRYLMPEWFAGTLGFQRIEKRRVIRSVEFVKLDGPVRVTIA